MPPLDLRIQRGECVLTRYIGVASFGASLPIRMIQTLVLNAAKLVGSHPMANLTNVSSEAEAFAWVAAQRRLLR